MRLVTVAGPPSCGKTSILTRTCAALAGGGMRCAAVKFDCLTSRDQQAYAGAGIPVSVVFSGGLCPDHFFATNLEEAFAWAQGTGADKDSVTITQVDGSSDAAQKGLKSGDVILEVGGLSVKTPQDVANGVKEATKLGRKAVLMRIKSGDQTRFVAVQLKKG